MNKFAWLLRREWMQHYRGWLILSVVPGLLVLLCLPVAHIDIDAKEVSAPGVLGALAASVYMSVVMLLVGAAVLFQAGGMARRDQQDRSVEFWVSLPTAHWQSVLATVLMHSLLMPLLVLVSAFVGAQVVAVAVVAKIAGAGAIGQLLGPSWVGFSAVALLRMALGVVASTLWLSAVLLGVMAAAAWLKGWGVPALVAAVALATLVVRQFSGSTIVWDVVLAWFRESAGELMPLFSGESTLKAALKSGADLDALRAWLWADTLRIFHDVATPAFGAAIVIGVVCFGLLVLQRASVPGMRMAWVRRAA